MRPDGERGIPLLHWKKLFIINEIVEKDQKYIASRMTSRMKKQRKREARLQGLISKLETKGQKLG